MPADAVLVDSAALSVAQRLGKPEKLERAESRDLGLRVFIGKRQAIVSTTDTSPGHARPSCSNAPSPWRGACRKTPTAGSPLPVNWPARLPHRPLRQRRTDQPFC